MLHEIFISYSSADVRIAEQLRAALEHAGIGCWIAPRDAQPGDKFQGSIIRAIRECRALVFLLSANSNRSEHVFRELHAASEAHKPIVPIRLDNVQPSDDLYYYLAPLHWLDAQVPPLERHIARLIEVLTPLVGRGVAHSTTGPQLPAARRTRPVRRRVVFVAAAGVVVAASVFSASRLTHAPTAAAVPEPMQGITMRADTTVEDRTHDLPDTAGGSPATGDARSVAELRIEEGNGGATAADQRQRAPAPASAPAATPPAAVSARAAAALRKELLGQQLTRLIGDPPPSPQALDEIRATTVALYHANDVSTEDRASAAYILGAAWRQQGNADECAIWLRRALQLRPEYPHYVRALERCTDGS